jgi:hypothetical protein
VSHGHTSPPPSFDRPNNIRRRAEIMKFLIARFSPIFSYSLPFENSYTKSNVTKIYAFAISPLVEECVKMLEVFFIVVDITFYQ